MVTLRPVGFTPGSIAGIAQSWVKLIDQLVDHLALADRARDGVITVSSGQWPMNQVS